MKKLVVKVGRWCGYDLAKTALGYEIKRLGAPSFSPEYIRSLGSPETVLDVGVGFGTPALYAAFPDAFHALVEPVVEFRPYMEGFLKRYRGAIYVTAVGSEESTQTINVDTNLQHSSMHKRTRAADTAKRNIPVTTLDRLLEEHDLLPPYGLKIDTEGFELEVIKGATQLLSNAQFVIAEVSFRKRFENSYTFAEFIAYMDSCGFSVTGILRTAWRRCDAAFKPDVVHN